MVKKEPRSFSHCGSFDHRDLQSLNECIFVFLVKFGNFQWCITCQILKISVGKRKKQICIRLMTANHGGQKNRNEKKTAVPFLPCFLLVN
jgi:hypothetical protein